MTAGPLRRPPERRREAVPLQARPLAPYRALGARRTLPEEPRELGTRRYPKMCVPSTAPRPV